MANYIWVKLSKEWGGFPKGDTVRIGLPKGPQLVEAEFGHEVPEPKDEKNKRLRAESKVRDDAKKAEEKKKAETKKAAEEVKLAEEEAKAAEEKKTTEKATKTPDAETADNRSNPSETKKK